MLPLFKGGTSDSTISENPRRFLLLCFVFFVLFSPLVGIGGLKGIIKLPGQYQLVEGSCWCNMVDINCRDGRWCQFQGVDWWRQAEVSVVDCVFVDVCAQDDEHCMTMQSRLEMDWPNHTVTNIKSWWKCRKCRCFFSIFFSSVSWGCFFFRFVFSLFSKQQWVANTRKVTTCSRDENKLNIYVKIPANVESLILRQTRENRELRKNKTKSVLNHQRIQTWSKERS